MIIQGKFFRLFFIVLFILTFILSPLALADEPTIYSPSAILIDSNSGNVLYEKNADAQMYPASTTKILTAIIAIESCSLDEEVTASENAITSIGSGYTNANIQVGETLTMEELLYALLLNSANEAANVIAEHIGGSTENFANIMNAKAIELGCQNTHFVNANGIHSDSHYTTASDLATIARYAMQNDTFRTMVSTLEYTLPATEQYPSTDRVLKNSNSLLISTHNYYYPYAIGIKTGFTTQAKNCLVAASSKSGLELISVVLHAETTDDGRGARYVDTISLLEYGNNNYYSYTLTEKDAVLDTIDVYNGSDDTKTLNILAKSRLAITLPNGEEPTIDYYEISYQEDIEAPIEAGEVLGTVTYVVGDSTYTTDLIAETNVDLPTDESSEETFSFSLLVWVILLICILSCFRICYHQYQRRS